MKKFIFVFVAVLFSAVNTLAQQFDWAINSGSFVQDEGHDVATDLTGNVFTTGTFRYTADFDPAEDSEFYITNNEASNVFVQKLNADGDLIWAIGFGGDDFDNGQALCTDAEGNCYVAGNFLSVADFDPDTTSTYNLTSAGIDDAFVVKLNANGEMLWAKQIGGTGTDEAYDVVTDNTGSVYVTGRFQNTCDFDPGSGVFDLTATSSSDDLFVCKLDSEGQFVWAKSAGSNGNDVGLSISVDPNGNVATTGYFWGVVDFDPGNGISNVTSVGAMDIYILKLDNDGNLVWAKQFGSTGYDIGYSVATDNDGNIYSTGRFESTTDFDPNSGVQNYTSQGEQDIYINKLSASGDFIWTKTIGASMVEWGQSIALDSYGGLYVTGFFQNTVDFNPGSEVANLVSLGNDDIFICKFDDSGNYVWSLSMGGSAPFDGDRGQSIAVDSEGTIYTTGWFFGSVDFDPGIGSEVLTSTGNYDIFLQRIEQPGIGITEHNAYSDFDLYPNPCDRIATIQCSESHRLANVRVIDALGKTIFYQNYNYSEIIQLDLRTLSGIYLVEVQMQDGTLVGKRLLVN
ncbi:MAG: SBBP repeat-containing protein [Flavobacteriales bacterium]